MAMSAGVAKLPDSASCLPKYSDGQELPARYRELRGAEVGTSPSGSWGQGGEDSTVLVPPLRCAQALVQRSDAGMAPWPSPAIRTGQL